MRISPKFWRSGVGAAVCLTLLVGTALAQAPNTSPNYSQPSPYPSYRNVPSLAQRPAQPLPTRPAYQLAERATPTPLPTPKSSPVSSERRPNEHPLMPALRWANQGLIEMDRDLQDYSATLLKRERIDGKLGEQQWMYIKVRHKPYSVYMYFAGPASVQGQEVIYVEGANDGKMWAHPNGLRHKIVGTVSLKPTSALAMKDQRYPITELGVRNLVRRLIEVGNNDSKYGECEVKFRDDLKIKDRACTCIQVVHPVPRRNFLFHIARIYVDKELNVPIRYASFDWPKETGGEPELIEEYTYLDLKKNVGFTDADFDIRNPNYRFK
ncbi:MAG: DUF1571 domain-containing protein [Pirellulales bacterium]|nr:DUF1571 domain-containing protein [Pirellulales bacterium]